MKIGILALQGDFQSHAEALSLRGAKSLLIKRASELSAVDGLILPGGESTALLTLLEPDLERALVDAVKDGLPALATCAGLILAARRVSNPEQRSLDLLDVDVTRNAYGRQMDSFIEPALQWTAAGRAALARLELDEIAGDAAEGVFIRAPKITRCGNGVVPLLEYRGDPVMVMQDSLIAASFHPELSEADAVYRIFFREIEKARA